MSTELSDKLYDKFNSAGCIKVQNLEEFRRRMQRAVQRKALLGQIKNPKLLDRAVKYYDIAQEPGARVTHPDEIVFSKRELYSEEKEYRFAFAKNKDVFKYGNLKLVFRDQIPPYLGNHTTMILKLGCLNDICQEIKD